MVSCLKSLKDKSCQIKEREISAQQNPDKDAIIFKSQNTKYFGDEWIYHIGWFFKMFPKTFAEKSTGWPKNEWYRSEACICSKSRSWNLLFHVCFGFRISQPIRWETYITPIHNVLRIKNALREVQFSKLISKYFSSLS